jgi:hypothetical protein
MANNLLANPMVITSSMSQGYKAATASALGSPTLLKIEKIYWENPANSGDTISIGDPASGLILLVLRCESANQSQIVDFTANPKLWRDFEINSVPSGTLYIYTC